MIDFIAVTPFFLIWAHHVQLFSLMFIMHLSHVSPLSIFQPWRYEILFRTAVNPALQLINAELEIRWREHFRALYYSSVVSCRKMLALHCLVCRLFWKVHTFKTLILPAIISPPFFKVFPDNSLFLASSIKWSWRLYMFSLLARYLTRTRRKPQSKWEFGKLIHLSNSVLYVRLC